MIKPAMHRSGSSILAAVPMWQQLHGTGAATQPPQTFTKPDPAPETSPSLPENILKWPAAFHSLLLWTPTTPPGRSLRNPGADPQFVRWKHQYRLGSGQPRTVVNPIISEGRQIGVATGSATSSACCCTSTTPAPLLTP